MLMHRYYSKTCNVCYTIYKETRTTFCFPEKQQRLTVNNMLEKQTVQDSAPAANTAGPCPYYLYFLLFRFYHRVMPI